MLSWRQRPVPFPCFLWGAGCRHSVRLQFISLSESKQAKEPPGQNPTAFLKHPMTLSLPQKLP